jgi:hypothetical protein
MTRRPIQRVLFALVTAGILGYLANPAPATPLNTTISSWFGGACKVEAAYGTFGTVPYATFRFVDTQYADGNCFPTAEASYYSLSGNSYRLIKQLESGISEGGYTSAEMPTPWFQVNGATSGTGYGGEFCFITIDHWIDRSENNVFRKYRWDMRFNDGTTAGTASYRGSYDASCGFTAP